MSIGEKSIMAASCGLRMIVAVLGRRIGTIVVVMLFRFLVAVIFGAILRTDGDGNHGGEGERRQG
jgi:hypothetical protein